MKRSPLFFCLLLFINIPLTAQVGIGTTNPSAELEIETTNTGIPALELNPQTTPVGDTMGQLAVIGDLLYMYDDVRDKWLSLESTALQFGRSGSSISNQTIHFGGNMASSGSGPLMPLDGTIVAVTANSSGGNATKRFQVRIRGASTTNTNFSLAANTFNSSTENINFSAGNYINVRARDDGNGDVSNLAVVVWVKWRE